MPAWLDKMIGKAQDTLNDPEKRANLQQKAGSAVSRWAARRAARNNMNYGGYGGYGYGYGYGSDPNDTGDGIGMATQGSDDTSSDQGDWGASASDSGGWDSGGGGGDSGGGDSGGGD